MTEPVALLDAASKRYGRKAIGPLSLALRRGEVMGLLGPNGSGKTTAIRMLLGLVRASSGRVLLNGRDPVEEHERALRGVGYSPELPNIQTFLTPNELLSIVCSELGLGSHESLYESRRLLEAVGLAEYADTKVGKLSKGMVQRLSLAQAMLGSPSILILDEPIIGVDPAGAVHFREMFREFAKDGGTILLSSHVMSEVSALCNSATMLHNGRVMFSGTLDDIVRAKLQGKVVVVEAEGLGEKEIGLIRSLEGVQEIKQSTGTIEIVVAPSATDLRPEIARIIVNSGRHLHSIKYEDNILERAYVASLAGGRAES